MTHWTRASTDTDVIYRSQKVFNTEIRLLTWNTHFSVILYLFKFEN